MLMAEQLPVAVGGSLIINARLAFDQIVGMGLQVLGKGVFLILGVMCEVSVSNF